MKKHKQTEQLFKDKRTEQKVVAVILLGLALYFGFQVLYHFLLL